MQRVSGSYYDGRRFREGTVGWEDDVVVEVRSGRARTPLAEGLIVPGLWNAHTHLGDAIVTQELKGTLEELVAPPHGLKHGRMHLEGTAPKRRYCRAMPAQQFSQSTLMPR